MTTPTPVVIDIPASLATVLPSQQTLHDAGMTLLGSAIVVAAIVIPVALVLLICSAISGATKNAQEKREIAARLAKMSREQRDELNKRGLEKFQNGELPLFTKLDARTSASLLNDGLIYWGLSRPSGPSNYRHSCYRAMPQHLLRQAQEAAKTPRVQSQTFINWLIHGGVNGVQVESQRH
jgi:hypothetical protein